MKIAVGCFVVSAGVLTLMVGALAFDPPGGMDSIYTPPLPAHLRDVGRGPAKQQSLPLCEPEAFVVGVHDGDAHGVKLLLLRLHQPILDAGSAENETGRPLYFVVTAKTMTAEVMRELEIEPCVLYVRPCRLRPVFPTPHEVDRMERQQCVSPASRRRVIHERTLLILR